MNVPVRYVVAVYLLILMSVILALAGIVGQAFDVW